MPNALRPTSGNGSKYIPPSMNWHHLTSAVARRQSTPSLRLPGPRAGGARATARSYNDLRNIARATANNVDIEDQLARQVINGMHNRVVNTQAFPTTSPTEQAPTMFQPPSTPLSASAISQGRVERWITALDLLERTRRQEAEEAGVAAATAELQALSISTAFPSSVQTSSIAPTAFSSPQPSPSLPMGCDECYDGGVMPCPECEEAMNLAAFGCRCEPGGITSCDHPRCRAAEYDEDHQDDEDMTDDVFGDQDLVADLFDDEYVDENDYEFGVEA
ncbi:hypothetical protein BZA77DRAFT_352454 [Pyronema omphalodes]|nr:hypothetical protein BZA77DRAFT_352454 [Pyronema omphalodes]